MRRSTPRLFYDVPSSPRMAELVLLASDVLLFAAPLLYVAVATHRTSGDVVSLALFAFIPRFMARFLEWLGRPKDTWKTFSIALPFVVTTGCLIVVGWELLVAGHPPLYRLGTGTALLTLCCWGTGFLLFHPRTYRLYDLLCGGVVLLGLFEEKPQPWLWVPLWLLALYFSASTRHLMRDVHARAPTPFVNLQNPRALSLGATLVSVAAFLLIALALRGSVEYPVPEEPPGGGGRGGGGTSRSLVAFPERGPGARSASGGGGFLQTRLSIDGEAGEGPATRHIAYRGDLTGLARRPDSQAVSLIVRRHGVIRDSGSPRPELHVDVPEDELHASLRWPLPPDALFKAVTFSIFEPDTHTWAEEAPLEKAEWPAGGELAVEKDRRLAGGDALFLEFEVVRPLFRNFVGLHWTQRLRTTLPQSYRFNSAGDVFPLPGLRRSDVYFLMAQPLRPNVVPANVSPGAAPEGRCLEVPPAASLGFNLRGLGRSVFRPGQDRIEALREFFRRHEFTYSRLRFWDSGVEPLRRFLLEERSGNCAYYATAAALLLRTAGVSARLAVGLAGGEWNDRREELYLRVSMGHAWVEVYYPGHGWYPIDPTAWVPRDERSPRTNEPESGAQLASRPEGSGEAPLPTDSGRRRTSGSSSGSRFDSEGSSRRRAGGPRRERGRDAAGPFDTGARDEELTEWIEFGSDEVLDGEYIVEDAVTVGRWEDELDGRGSSSGRLLDPAAAHGDESSLATTLQRFKVPLRGLLIGLAIVACVLFAATFRRSEEADDEETVDDATNEGLVTAGLAGGPTRELVFDPDCPREAIVGGYYELQCELALTRSQRRPAQTPLEHGRGLSRRHESVAEPLRTVVALFYKALYSEAKISAEDVETFRGSCRAVLRGM